MAVKKKKQSVQSVSKTVSANKKNAKADDLALSGKSRAEGSSNGIKKTNFLFAEQLSSAIKFLGEVRTESRKISWPERSQVIRETVSVLFLVVLITLLVLGFDWLMGKFVFAPLEHWGHLYGIGK